MATRVSFIPQGRRYTVPCEICGTEDYGSPCDKCCIEVMEVCPYCYGQHAISEQPHCERLGAKEGE